MRAPRGITLTDPRVVDGELVYTMHVARWKMIALCARVFCRIALGKGPMTVPLSGESARAL